MKNKSWHLTISVLFISLSAIIYSIQIMVFHNTQETFFLLFQDLSFVPINVLLVTFFLDRLMKKREKQAFLNKLNMIIGVFFNDLGLDFIRQCNTIVPDIGKINSQLQVSAKWTDSDFADVKKNLCLNANQLSPDADNLNALREYLQKKKESLLALLANPNLLEHDAFTNLLWAVFHLADELSHRNTISTIPQTDIDHLKVDIHRAYRLVIIEWVLYMKHLKQDYPYLFSVSVRTNPFNPDADIIVE